MLISSPLYVICDADACRRAGWTLIDFASACLDGGARLLADPREGGAVGRGFSTTTLAIVERARSRRAGDRERSRGHRAAGRSGRRARRPGRSVAGGGPRDPWRGGDRRVVHAHAEHSSTRRCPSRFPTSRSVRSSRPRPKSTGYDALGLSTACEMRRRRAHRSRVAARRDWRHHAGPRRGGARAGRRRGRGDRRSAGDQRSAGARARLSEPSFKVIIRLKRLILEHFKALGFRLLAVRKPKADA